MNSPHSTYSQLPNSQSACPFFSVIPAEIRNRIFYLALLEEEDLSNYIPADLDSYLCSRESYNMFPGIALLRTCKLVYLETHLLPILTTTHRDWQQYPGPPYYESVPPGVLAKNTRERWALMMREQKSAVVGIHVYVGEDWSRWQYGPFIPDYHSMRREGLKPKTFAVTLRWNELTGLARSNHDGYDWDDGDGDAKMKTNLSYYKEKWEAWFNTFGDGLEEMVMHLEAKVERQYGLERVVKSVREWTLGPLKNGGKVWGANEVALKREIREGVPLSLGGVTRDDDAARQKDYVVTVTWKAVSGVFNE